VIRSGNFGLELNDKQLARVFLVEFPKEKFKVLISMLGKEADLTTEKVKAALFQEDLDEYEKVSGAFPSTSSRGRGGSNFHWGRHHVR
jgi:hypothetical protein